MSGVDSVAIGCVVARLVDPFLEPDFVLPFSTVDAFACLLRLLFGWTSASESSEVLGSGDRALLADTFLVEVEEDFAPADLGFAIF
jgi:hypothetical protein